MIVGITYAETETVTYHIICSMIGAASGAGTSYTSQAPTFTPDFSGVRVLNLLFSV
jgi:hypothetical protein